MKMKLRNLAAFLWIVVAALPVQACPHCGAEGHDADARFCKYCGSRL